MAINFAKCTHFEVKEEFSKTGKSQGFAIKGKAKPHDTLETIKHDGQVWNGLPTRADADYFLKTLKERTAP